MESWVHRTYESISKLSNNFLEYLTGFLLPSNDFNVNKFNNNLAFQQSRNSDINIDIKETMQKYKTIDRSAEVLQQQI